MGRRGGVCERAFSLSVLFGDGARKAVVIDAVANRGRRGKFGEDRCRASTAALRQDRRIQNFGHA